MNCTNCGKEIPEGENKLCEECQNKLLEELSKEESPAEEKVSDEVKEEVVAEEKTEEEKEEDKKEKKNKKEKKSKKGKKENKEDASEETKKEENSESKEESKKDESKKTSTFKISKENLSNKKNIIIALIAIVVVVLVAIVLTFILTGKTNVGNTIGNVRNYGYATSDGKWIYYLSPSDDTEKVGICKVKTNGENKEELLMDSIDVLSINVYKDYLYFIGIGLESYSDTDEVDNKIYRMKTDGSDLEVINDNEFNNECYEVYVLNNSIYYIGTDENIYKMKLDGTKRELVSDNGTGYIGITDKYIIYNVENEAGDDYVTYIMNIDGTNQRPILENRRLYSVDIAGNYVYYTNTDKQIYRTAIDSGEEELVLDDTAYNLNLSGDYLYFLNYVDAENEDYTVALFRVKVDGSETEAQNIKTLSSYSTFINVVGDWVMYMDNDSESGFINLVNKNANGEEKKIYELNYASYYESIEDEVTSDDGENVQTPEEVTEGTNTTEDGAQAPTENVAQ